MARLRRLIKSLEAVGWQITERRSGLLRLTHPSKLNILTLPERKQAIPDAVSDAVMQAAGLTPTNPTAGVRR